MRKPDSEINEKAAAMIQMRESETTSLHTATTHSEHR